MKSLRQVFALLSIMVSSVSGWAEELITKPYTFAPKTAAKAEEVNANFDLLYKQMNELLNWKKGIVPCPADGSIVPGCTKPTPGNVILYIGPVSDASFNLLGIEGANKLCADTSDKPIGKQYYKALVSSTLKDLNAPATSSGNFPGLNTEHQIVSVTGDPIVSSYWDLITLKNIDAIKLSKAISLGTTYNFWFGRAATGVTSTTANCNNWSINWNASNGTPPYAGVSLTWGKTAVGILETGSCGNKQNVLCLGYD